MKINWGNIWQWIKKHIWYAVLLVASSIYVTYYRFEIHQLSELNAQSLIFILWLILLLLPLFSEMEFLGVKVKREIEKSTTEVKDCIHDLQLQIMQMQISNTVATSIQIDNTLATPQKLDEMKQTASSSTPQPEDKGNDSIDMKNNHFLFEVRLALETTIRDLYEKMGFSDRAGLTQMAHKLLQSELISGVTYDILRQIIIIANRGVHGEIISNEYVSFVREMYPGIIDQLKIISSKLTPIACRMCKYVGYTTHDNVCPKCGSINIE